jgi:exonuclease SbcC
MRSVEELRAQTEELADKLAKHDTLGKAASQKIVERAAAAAVEAPIEDLHSAVVEAHTRASQSAEKLAADLVRRTDLEVQKKKLQQRFAVASSLESHLRADKFERWLVAEALHELVVGATDRLVELSSGAYSLEVTDDGRDFEVIDHQNADERRSVRTLSGGETFLTSLALALALAERIGGLAERGGLESLFLDEGFGTLDPTTLDVVASAIEELGSHGRTIGVITHVRELADRLPTRFEVLRTTTGATVERVSA